MKKVDYYKFSIYRKVSNKINYYRKNRDIILNRTKEYYENNRKRFKEQARNEYRKFSGEEKSIKREFGRNRYKNMSKENKERLKEYKKNYHQAKHLTKTFFSFPKMKQKTITFGKVGKLTGKKIKPSNNSAICDHLLHCNFLPSFDNFSVLAHEKKVFIRN